MKHIDNEESQGTPTVGRAVGRFFWELIKAFLIAMAIIIPIRYYLVQPFFVRGASMEPTFDDGEYLVIDQLSYRFREPRRGEVVVFRYPKRPSQFFIKRIVGLPDERVVIDDGTVTIYNDEFVSGVQLNEASYLPERVRTGGQVDVQLTSDEYFVLGDNRPQSSDSRSWGTLPSEDIIGRTWIRAYPFDELEVFDPESPGFLGAQGPIQTDS